MDKLDWSILSNATVAATLGAVVGGILTGLFSLWIARKNTTRKKITAVIRDVTSLLEISSKIRSSLSIDFEGRKISSLYLTSIDVINTGNSSIEGQRVVINFPVGSEILECAIATKPLMDLEDIDITIDKNCIKCLVKLMNAGEKLSFDIVSTGNKDTSVDVAMRNKDVLSELIDERNSEFKSVSSILVQLMIGFLSGFSDQYLKTFKKQ